MDVYLKLHCRGKDSVLKLQLKHEFYHLSRLRVEVFVSHEGFNFVYGLNALTIKSKGFFSLTVWDSENR